MCLGFDVESIRARSPVQVQCRAKSSQIQLTDTRYLNIRQRVRIAGRHRYWGLAQKVLGNHNINICPYKPRPKSMAQVVSPYRLDSSDLNSALCEPRGLVSQAAESVWYLRTMEVRAGESTSCICLGGQLKIRGC